MWITRKIKLLSPFLSERRDSSDGENKRRFSRVKCPEGLDDSLIYIATPLHRWKWAFLEARDALGLDDVCVSTIIPCRYFTVKRTSTFNRNYKVGRVPKKEKFESLQSGQVVDIMFTLSRHLPPVSNEDRMASEVRPPDEEEFDAMLTHIGQHLGMSEFGHGYEYGRFEIKK